MGHQELNIDIIVTLELVVEKVFEGTFLWFICIIFKEEIEHMQPLKICSSRLSIKRFCL